LGKLEVAFEQHIKGSQLIGKAVAVLVQQPFLAMQISILSKRDLANLPFKSRLHQPLSHREGNQKEDIVASR